MTQYLKLKNAEVGLICIYRILKAVWMLEHISRIKWPEYGCLAWSFHCKDRGIALYTAGGNEHAHQHTIQVADDHSCRCQSSVKIESKLQLYVILKDDICWTDFGLHVVLSRIGAWFFWSYWRKLFIHVVKQSIYLSKLHRSNEYLISESFQSSLMSKLNIQLKNKMIQEEYRYCCFDQSWL